MRKNGKIAIFLCTCWRDQWLVVGEVVVAAIVVVVLVVVVVVAVVE